MSRLHAALYHVIQRARGERVGAILRTLEESQWWSADRLRALQLERLRDVVGVAARAGHYRAAWSIRGETRPLLRSFEEFAALPVLEKQVVRADPEALRDPMARVRVETRTTTGSSGVPLRFVRSTKAGAYGRASQLLGRSWFGVRLCEREVRLGGVSLESLGRWRARLIDFLMNRLRLEAFDLSDERLDRFWKRIERFRPAVLYGYPSALTVLAAFVQRRGEIPPPFLKVIFSSSETLFEHRRSLIRSIFQCPVVDEYGAAEVSIIGMECPAGSMHLAAENVYLEIVDETGRPLPPGDEGDVVVTDLNNLAAPLVRYRLGDRARWVTEACRCGRGLPCLQVVAGSTFGLISLPDGRVVSGAAFHFLAEAIITRADAGVSEMVIVRRGEAFVARVVPRPGGNPAHVEELRARLREILGPTAPLALERVSRIARNHGDKYRIVLEERPQRAEEAPADGPA